jgi:hypothetical protein
VPGRWLIGCLGALPLGPRELNAISAIIDIQAGAAQLAKTKNADQSDVTPAASPNINFTA